MPVQHYQKRPELVTAIKLDTHSPECIESVKSWLGPQFGVCCTASHGRGYVTIKSKEDVLLVECVVYDGEYIVQELIEDKNIHKFRAYSASVFEKLFQQN